MEAQGCNRPPHCTTHDPDNLMCTACDANTKLTPQGDCIVVMTGKWAHNADCVAAFNATHCAECNTQILAIDD